jgi:arsenate reductase (glutaredoxin)
MSYSSTSPSDNVGRVAPSYSERVMVTIYGIKNCDTMKKARAWLDGRGVGYAFHDYAKSGIERAQLARWSRDVGWERLCNRAGTTFKKLPEVQTRDLTEAKALDLMVAKPSMIKRPVLTIDGSGRERILVGFSPESYADALQQRP